jgi:hypothetical protein
MIAFSAPGAGEGLKSEEQYIQHNNHVGLSEAPAPAILMAAIHYFNCVL